MKPEDLKPGLKVRHYKGGEYRIIALAHIEGQYDANDPRAPLCVVYGDGTRNWIRPMETDWDRSVPFTPFCGDIEPGVPRFTLIPEDDA